MAKAYWISCYRSISNPDALQAYAKLAAPAIQKSGGRFIVRGMPSAIHEKGVKERVVIAEFDNVHKAMAAHDSADYKKALDVLGDGAERDFRIVEGV